MLLSFGFGFGFGFGKNYSQREAHYTLVVHVAAAGAAAGMLVALRQQAEATRYTHLSGEAHLLQGQVLLRDKKELSGQALSWGGLAWDRQRPIHHKKPYYKKWQEEGRGCYARSGCARRVGGSTWPIDGIGHPFVYCRSQIGMQNRLTANTWYMMVGGT